MRISHAHVEMSTCVNGDIQTEMTITLDGRQYPVLYTVSSFSQREINQGWTWMRALRDALSEELRKAPKKNGRRN